MNAEPGELWSYFDEQARALGIPESDRDPQVGSLIRQFRIMSELYHCIARGDDMEPRALELHNAMVQGTPHLAAWPLVVPRGDGFALTHVTPTREPEKASLYLEFLPMIQDCLEALLDLKSAPGKFIECDVFFFHSVEK